MSYILDYFDLNKRISITLAKKKKLSEQVQVETKNNSEQEIDNSERSGTQSGQSQSSGSSLEDPLLDDMNAHWYDYGDALENDVKNKKQRKNSFSLFKFKLSSLVSSLHDTFFQSKVEAKSSFPWLQQVILYSGNIIGAMLSSTVIEHQVGTDYQFDISLSFVILSSMLALIVSPIVFEKLYLTNTESFYADFFLFIQNGVFWYVIIKVFFLMFG